MTRRALVLIAASLSLLWFGACSNNDDPSDAGAATTVAPTSTTSTTVSSGPAKTEKAAADGLFNAWRRGDRADASRYARTRAIEELFAHPNTGDVTYVDQGCEPQGGQFICSWTYPGGVLQMTVEAVAGGGFVVDDITYIAD